MYMYMYMACACACARVGMSMCISADLASRAVSEQVVAQASNLVLEDVKHAVTNTVIVRVEERMPAHVARALFVPIEAVLRDDAQRLLLFRGLVARLEDVEEVDAAAGFPTLALLLASLARLTIDVDHARCACLQASQARAQLSPIRV